MTATSYHYSDLVPTSNEYVSFKFVPSKLRCIPVVHSTANNLEREFMGADLNRVADFDKNVNAEEAPPPGDGMVQFGEPKDGDEADRNEILEQEQTYDARHDVVFQRIHVALRGKFLFAFDKAECEEQLDFDPDTGRYDYTRATPYAVIPLDRVAIDLPPGGRRVFREHSLHAQGYEFCIRHKGPKVGAMNTVSAVPGVDEIQMTRIPFYLVVESLIQRDEWIAALVARTEARGKTFLKIIRVKLVDVTENGEKSNANESSPSPRSIMRASSKYDMLSKENRGRSFRRQLFRSSTLNETAEEGLERSIKINEIVRTYGENFFSTEDYVLDFFGTTDDAQDIEMKLGDLNHHQDLLKDGLRSAVLEQYKYFVDASREISVMGIEMQAMARRVDEHTQLINDMNVINFTGIGEQEFDEKSVSSNEIENYDEDVSSDEDEDYIADCLNDGKTESSTQGRNSTLSYRINSIEFPGWIFETNDEIEAYVKECQYTEATTNILKLKEELNRIMNEHLSKGSAKLTKVQLDQMQQMQQQANKLISIVRDRLVERLRRTNEALRQERKRERSDPVANEYAPLLSPICLEDDDPSLLLLVKLKRYNDAAIAYDARRSLLLDEVLNERYISTNTAVDIEVSVKQLCRVYFCCVAEAISGFLYLLDLEDDELGNTNIHDGALSQIVLWLDCEIDKFALTFGGPHILGRLALTPGKNAHAQARARSQELINDQKKQLESAESMGNQAAAASLRRKIAKAEYDAEKQSNRQRERERTTKENDIDGTDVRSTLSPEKDRILAIKVAANCIHQAFKCASDELDNIGFPLVPRLASSFRPHLQGCESEIASLLKPEWSHIVNDWFTEESQVMQR